MVQSTMKGEIMEKLLTAEEFAELAQIKTHSAYRYAREGKVPHVRIGNKLRFVPSQIQEWIRAQTAQSNQAEAENMEAA
jgi:excisionase family DNA binding protein